MIKRNVFFHFHKKKLALTCILLVIVFCLSALSVYAVDDEYLKYCTADVVEAKYIEAGCWSCEVVKVLMDASTNAAALLFDNAQELSMIILGLGSAIWYALFFLKAVGSFAAQDPAKLIDGVLVFTFKIMIVYVLLSAGIDTILEYTVNPLLGIGQDIGNVFLDKAKL